MQPTALNYPDVISWLQNDQRFIQTFLAYIKRNGGSLDQSKTLAQFVESTEVKLGTTLIHELFNKQFPDTEHFLVLGFKFYDGDSVTLTSTNWNPGISIANLKNATFEVNNNGTNVLKNYPLTQAADSADNNHDPGAIYLMKPITWLGQTNLTMTVKLPAAATGTNPNLRCEAIGLKFI